MKGRVNVLKENLEARFSWIPDRAKGRIWDVDALRTLLSEADVRVEVPEAVLKESLAFFHAHSDPAQTPPVARGTHPVAHEPLRARTKSTSLPSEVEKHLESILKDVPASSDDVRYGWALERAMVARLIPGVAPRAGVDLNREPIDPPESEEEDFRIGDHLLIDGESLVAECEGILRMEDGWADLVPCKRHEWSVSGSPEDGGCFLTYHPGHPALPLPGASQVTEAAFKQGFVPDKLIPEKDIRALLSEAAQSGKAFQYHPITLNTDSRIEIEVDSRRTHAHLVLRRETGEGKALHLESIAAVIRSSGLRGLNGPAVKADILKFWKSQNQNTQILIKEGVEPGRGPDRTLDFQVPFFSEAELTAVQNRLKEEPEKLRGIPSLRSFPPEIITKMAPVSQGQVLLKLGTAKSGQPGKDIDGKELPGFPGNDPEVHVHEGLSWEGDVLKASAEGVLDVGERDGGCILLRVRPHLDAHLEIQISEDKLRALLTTRLPVGTGAPITPQRIQRVAEEQGVVKGLSFQALQKAAERSLTGEILSGFVIAEGRLPMADDTRLTLAVEGDPAKKPVPVRSGDAIGVLETGGDDAGWNVLGEPLSEDQETLSIGENIKKTPTEEGTTVLTAEKGGHLMLSDGSLFIRDFLDYVGNVSLASGGIRFPGRVKVDGSVLPRVVVDGGEGVEITQIVQAALVNSDGNVVIKKGVKGDGKALIRCQGTLSLGYAEDASLLASENIKVTKALLNCRVKCNGKAVFAPGGKLLGGTLKLKDGLVCEHVGNERGVKTLVSFGQDYLVENQIEQIDGDIKKIQEFVNRIDQLLVELQAKGAEAKLIPARRKKVDALKMLEKKNLKLFLLREKFERHFESEVQITGTAWPGVVFESHGRLLEVREPLHSVSIVFNRERARLERRPL